MAFLQAFHLPERGCKSAQRKKIGLSDSFGDGYLSKEAQVYHRITDEGMLAPSFNYFSFIEEGMENAGIRE